MKKMKLGLKRKFLCFSERFGFGKKGIVWEKLIPWIIAVAVIVVIFIFIVLLRGEGTSFWDKIKNIFRFR